jgi:hypothetical protein
MVSVSSSKFRFFSLIAHLVFWKNPGKSLSGHAITWLDFLSPFVVTLDLDKKQLEVQKRNWFLIGVDSKIFNFGQVRNVTVNEHLITASIEIRVYAGKLEAHWFRKKDIQEFKTRLMAISRHPSDLSVFVE